MGTFETAQKGEALIQEYYDLTERKVPVWLEWIPYIAGTKHETFQLHYGDCIIHIGESGYVVDFKKLKTFDISKYPEKVQTTHEQDNDSWGRCVPIVALEAAGVIFATRNMNELRARAAK